MGARYIFLIWILCIEFSNSQDNVDFFPVDPNCSKRGGICVRNDYCSNHKDKIGECPEFASQGAICCKLYQKPFACIREGGYCANAGECHEKSEKLCNDKNRDCCISY